MSDQPTDPNGHRGRWVIIQILTLAGGLVVAAVLGKLTVARLWTYQASGMPERFPWGSPITEQSVRTFEEWMGFLVFALILCPVLNGLVVRGIRRRMGQ